jgi:hypothetical protein
MALPGPKPRSLTEVLAQPLPKDAIPGGVLEGVEYHKVQRRIAEARRQAADERGAVAREAAYKRGILSPNLTLSGLDRSVYCSRCGQDTRGRQYPANGHSPNARVCFDCASPEAREAIRYPEE